MLFDRIRKSTGYRKYFTVVSSNNFPASAGLASSSSGMAALVYACVGITDKRLDSNRLSRLAQIGSGSAARSIYGGFTRLAQGKWGAKALFPADWWPELRVIVAVTEQGKKAVSTTAAMRRTKASASYYNAWVRSSSQLTRMAEKAIAARDLTALGEAMRASYLRMTGLLFSAVPPILYWNKDSVAIIKRCEEMRSSGIAAWETMDAGPQVKIVTTTNDCQKVYDAIVEIGSTRSIIVSAICGAPVISYSNNLRD